MTGRPRDPYSAVGAAIRQAYARARVAGTTEAERDVLAAVVELVASYSRLSDRIALERVASSAQRHPKTAARALRRLASLSIIVYTPGQGRQNLSLIGLAPALEKGAPSDSVNPAEKGAEPRAEKGAKLRPKKGASRGSLPEKTSEKTSENGNGNRPWLPLHPSRYTGCRWTRGQTSGMHVYHPLGTDRPPDGWPHPKPSIDEIAAALRDGSTT